MTKQTTKRYRVSDANGVYEWRTIELPFGVPNTNGFCEGEANGIVARIIALEEMMGCACSEVDPVVLRDILCNLVIEDANGPYYTLLVRECNSDPWEIHFGDYNRECVVDESAEVTYGWHAQTKIIKTSDAQADIEAEVARLNAEIGYGPDQELPPGAPIYK